MTPGDNRLAVLAADIQAAHTDVGKNALAAAERALAAGRMLVEAKAALAHGAWAGWLEKEVGIPARTARRYMALARAGVPAATVAEMGIRFAGEMLSHKRVPRPSPGAWAEAISEGDSTCHVWQSNEHPGYFHVLVSVDVSNPDGTFVAPKRPVIGSHLALVVEHSGFRIGSALWVLRKMEPHIASQPDAITLEHMEEVRRLVVKGWDADGRVAA